MIRAVRSLAYRLRRVIQARLGLETHGVKLLIVDAAGRILLVRHSYGRSDLYMLPGGGIARREAPERAAARELLEETGCVARELVLVGRYESRAEGRRDHIFLFHGVTDDVPVPDGRELTETIFVAPDALPAGISPATRRRIEEWQGRRERVGDW